MAALVFIAEHRRRAWDYGLILCTSALRFESSPLPDAAALRQGHSLQRLFRRAGEDFAGRLEARAVARAIPRLVRGVPADDAFQMGADGRHQDDPAIRGAI